MKLHEFLDYQKKLWEMDKKRYDTSKRPQSTYTQNPYNKKANNNIKSSK